MDYIFIKIIACITVVFFSVFLSIGPVKKAQIKN